MSPPNSRKIPPTRPHPSSISAADYPALRSFLRGYFHQDTKDEYGSIEEAVQEFCGDASSDERAAVAKEWSRFMDQIRGKPLEEVNQILTGPLGSSRILSGEDFDRISAVLSTKSRKPGPH